MNEQNLKPFPKGRSSDEARAAGSKGGKASVAAKRERKMIRDCLLELLDKPVEELSGMTGREAIVAAAFKRAAAGDMKAFELIRDTVGEKPATDVVFDTDRSLNVHIDVVE